MEWGQEAKADTNGVAGTCDRRGALALLAAGAAAVGSPAPAWARATGAGRPMLGTPDQLAAESLLRRLNRDPDIIRLQNQLKAELLQTAIGRTPAGAATVERAVAQWTNSEVFNEICTHRKIPTFLWGTDDTPRTWFGYTLGGVGTSGDNPDAVYRTAIVDGDKNYEILGWIDRTNPATQLVIQIDHANMVNPASMFDMSSPKPSIVSATLGLFTDKDLNVAADGSFRLTVGPTGQGPLHVVTKPGQTSLGIRDLMSDWRQRACRLAVREIGSNQPLERTTAELLDYAAIKQATLQDLPGYVRFWGKFPEIWFGGIKPNTISEARGRNGGWGFIAGLNFKIAPDEAVLVTTGRGGAAYTGFQINDPWMIQPDVMKNQACLNLSQTTANADGSVTYVIAAKDPGVANWLDTVGLDAGIGIIRWQAVPAGATKDGLIRDFRVIKLAELEGMSQIPRVTPEQRRAQIAARGPAYATRTIA